MVLATPGVSDRQLILRTLRSITRRRRAESLFRSLAWGIGLLLLALILLRFLDLLLGWRTPAGTVASAMLAGMVVHGTWSALRAGGLARAAGIADVRANLHDELKTAFHFMRAGTSSPWVDLQIQRAAATAHHLDAKHVIPWILPRPILLIDGALLAIVFSLSLHDGRAASVWEPERAASALRSSVEGELRRIEELLDPGEGREAEPEESRRTTLQRLGDTLRRVERGDAGLEEGLKDLEEIENRLTAETLDADAVRGGLEEIAGRLAGSDSMDGVARALEGGDLKAAVELLRALAERMSKADPGEDAREILDRLKNAETGQASVDEWLEVLRQAVEAGLRGDGEEAEARMIDASRGLESMERLMKAGERMVEAGRRLQEIRGGLARGLRAEVPGSRKERPAGLRIIETLDEEARALAEKLAAIETAELPNDAAPGSLPIGPVERSRRAPAEKATPLKVQLEREVLEARRNPPPEEIREEETKEQRSHRAYQPIRPPPGYAPAQPLAVEPIPRRLRDLVQAYFLLIARDSNP